MDIIVDRIGEVVNSMQNLSEKEGEKYGILPGLNSPFYFFGHPIDVNKQLIQRDQDKVNKHRKYPAIVLRLPTREEMYYGMIHYDLNIAILAETNVALDTPDRYEKVIKPILIPLYELFLDRLKSHKFSWKGNQIRAPHVKIDQPFYGVPETQGNKAYIFSNPLDAIEIVSLKINSQFKHC